MLRKKKLGVQKPRTLCTKWLVKHSVFGNVEPKICKQNVFFARLGPKACKTWCVGQGWVKKHVKYSVFGEVGLRKACKIRRV